MLKPIYWRYYSVDIGYNGDASIVDLFKTTTGWSVNQRSAKFENIIFENVLFLLEKSPAV